MSVNSIRDCGHIVMHYVNTHHTTKLALIGGGLCALAATELAVRTLHNLWQVLNNDWQAYGRDFGQTVSRNIGGMIFFGACATNAIPSLAAIGGIVLIANAIVGDRRDDALLVTKAIRSIRPVTAELFKGIWNIVQGIFEMAKAILIPIGNVLGQIFFTVIPRTPEAVAAVIVVGAIVIYKGVLKR